MIVSTVAITGGLERISRPNNSPAETIMPTRSAAKIAFERSAAGELDVYLYEYKNYQVDSTRVFPGETGRCSEISSRNAANARHKRMELETQALLTRHDTLALNVSYLSAVFQNFQYPAPVDPAARHKRPSRMRICLAIRVQRTALDGTLKYQPLGKLPRDAQLALFLLSHAEIFTGSRGSPSHSRQPRDTAAPGRSAATQLPQASTPYGIRTQLENRAVYNNYTFRGRPGT